MGTGFWFRTATMSRTQSNLTAISTSSFLVMSDKYGSNRYGYNTNLLLSLNINGLTLYNNFLTGSMIQITIPASPAITQKSSCQIWVQNEPQVFLTCIVTTNLITIYSLKDNYATSNNIFVTWGIINPATSIIFTMNMYSYYYSSSRNSLVISTTATYTVDATYQAYTQVAKSRILMSPFKSRQLMVSNSPMRFRFKISSSPGSITYGGLGQIVITNTQIQYSSAFLCYFKQYATYQIMAQ